MFLFAIDAINLMYSVFYLRLMRLLKTLLSLFVAPIKKKDYHARISFTLLYRVFEKDPNPLNGVSVLKKNCHGKEN